MRGVQKLVQVLQVILGLKQDKKYDEALDAIHDSYERFFDEKKVLQIKDIDELVELCTKEGEFSPDLAFALADIINEEADILELQGGREAVLKHYQTTLKLYRRALAEKEAAVPVDVMNKIKYLKNKIG